MKRGISLITLIITIVVIIILAAAVILSLTANNPINSAKKAALISNRESIMSSINLYYSNATINLNIQNNFNNSYNQETILTGIGNTEDMTGEVKSYRIVSLKGGVDENSNSLTKDDIERETIQIENNDIEVFKIDEKKAEEKGINIPSTNKNSSWYFDKNGSVYLVFEEDADIPSNIKGNPEEGKLIEDSDLSKFISKKGYKYIKKSIYDLVPESPVEMFTYSTSTNDSGERVATITGLNPSYPTEKIPKEIKFPAIYKDESGNEYKVTTINSSDFRNREDFETIIVTEGIISINNEAFRGCTNLANVYLPTTLTKISTSSISSFNACTNIKKIVVPNSIVSNAKLNPKMIFSSSIKSIEEVEFSNEITQISSSAFSNFSAIKTINLPDSLEEIGNNAFSGCSNLSGKVVIPKGVKSIGSSAFYSCNITELEFKSEGTLTSIGTNAFYGNGELTNLVIPEGVESIGNEAFRGCTNLTSVYLPSTLSQISTSSISPFNACSNIKNITVPNYIVGGTSILPSNVFSSSKSEIMSVKFSDTITSISANAFSGFSSITSITIPESVTQIGNNAFSGCSNLSGKVVIPKGVKSIGSSAFYSCNITELEFKSEGALTSIETNAFFGNKGLVDLVVPEGVESIGNEAFRGCTSLTSVYLPSTLTKISTSSISSFNVCPNIKNITVPNYMVSGSSILPSNVFSSSKAGITSVKFSGIITSISANAFSGFSSITSITIPESVTQIRSSAFSGCSSLTTINYKGDATGAPWGATNATVIK